MFPINTDLTTRFYLLIVTYLTQIKLEPHNNHENNKVGVIVLFPRINLPVSLARFYYRKTKQYTRDCV